MRISSALHRVGASMLMAAMLTACGGDDDAPAVVAANDTLTIALGANGKLLANDTVAGVAATVGANGNASFALNSTPPAGITVNNGQVNVGATTAPGAYTLNYRLCEAGSSSNCADATAQITVPAPAIVAVADNFTLAAGASADVLANDTLGGVAATVAQVTVSASGALPTGITLSPAGVVAVTGAAAGGLYPVGYRICQTTVPANCATSTANVTVAVGATLSGRVVDFATAAGVPDVRVTVGNLSATTGADGAFTLSGVAPAARVNVVFTASTHSETVRIASIAATGNSEVQARLVRLGASTDLPIAAGGTVTLPAGPAQVVLPANALQRADGSVPAGNVSVRLTALDPASDSTVMPGDFTTLVNGTPTPIESFGAINVDLRDAAGAALNLRAGQSATIRIPLSSRNGNPPATVPLYWFNNDTGRWVEEGSATLAGSGASRYYEGTVTHFTTWNADQVYNTVTVTGCVADANGNRVANAQVFSDGISYSGTSRAVSDAGGNFTIPIRRDSQATLVGLSSGLLSNTLSAGPYSADTTLTNCLALGATGAGITMKLTWGARPSDLDSHLLTPDGTHVYYSREGSLTAAPFANLDVDDTSSYGPEVVTLTKLMVGTYKYYVVNYSRYGSGPIGASNARVELNIPGRAAELFTPPASGESANTDYWTLFEIDVDAQCNVTVRRGNAYSNSAPPTPQGTATYCTRP